MLDQIINFYKTELGLYKLVLRYTRSVYLIFVITALLSVITFSAGTILHTLSNNVIGSKVAFALWGVCFLLFWVTFFVLNWKAKAVLHERYGLEQKEFMWGGVPFWQMRCSLLISHLQKHNLYSERAISFLIEALSREISSRRSSRLELGAITIGLLIAIWSEPVKSLYRVIDTIDQKITFSVSLTLIILAGVFIRWAVVAVAKSILERDLEQMKELQKLLVDSYLVFQKENSPEPPVFVNEPVAQRPNYPG